MLLRFGDCYLDPSRIISVVINPPEESKGKGKGKPALSAGEITVYLEADATITRPLDAAGVDELRGWLAVHSEMAGPAPPAAQEPQTQEGTTSSPAQG